MSNANYIRGRRWEYETLAYLKKLDSKGFGGRFAGSHGLFDVIWVSPRDKVVYFVQDKVKKGNPSHKVKSTSDYDSNLKCYKFPGFKNKYMLDGQYTVATEKWTKYTRC